jgi:hypothetical protein
MNSAKDGGLARRGSTPSEFGAWRVSSASQSLWVQPHIRCIFHAQICLKYFGMRPASQNRQRTTLSSPIAIAAACASAIHIREVTFCVRGPPSAAPGFFSSPSYCMFQHLLAHNQLICRRLFSFILIWQAFPLYSGAASMRPFQ